jgi:flagellar motility protein MotE (MotC chaperone)
MMMAPGIEKRAVAAFAIVSITVALLAISPRNVGGAERSESSLFSPPVDRPSRSIELHPDAAEPRPAAKPMTYQFRLALEDSHGAKDSKEAPEPEEALPPASKDPELTPAQSYCASIMDATSAAQIAQQTRGLTKVQKEIDDKIALLDAKAGVLKNWMKQRDDFAQRATDSLVQIYSRMKPDAAAAQLAYMDEMTSAAILSKLNPKISSPIMAEMEVAKAARMSAIIARSGEMAIKPERKADAQQ